MATLGPLSAGIAHELNNPVAAIERAVDFVGEDVIKLLGDVPDGEAIQTVMLAAMESEPVSARVTRQRRESLAQAVGDDLLARRLVDIGVVSVEEYERRFARLTPVDLNRLLTVMSRYYQLGRSLRNISRCADRIAAMVRSLRSYARADHQWAAEVNVHAGIEDTLLMFGHALREIAVRRRYGDLPPIECHPGELNQVWTNVISNAIDAMKSAGQLTIDTDAPDAEHVRVRISDSGGGISPEHVKRVFDLNFTTKSGKGKFGLGMGLAICRQIVARHGGAIEIESSNGGTTVTIVLPVRFRLKPRENAES
jgi:signal transduction histidine kinase